MTTLTINTVCKVHTPHKEAISYFTTSLLDDGQEATFCEVCEQNIDRFCFYDDDRGYVWSSWSVTK